MKGCTNCKHYDGFIKCKAYPKGIPLPIMAGDIAHDRPLKGDKGIQYESIKKSGQ